VQAGFAVEVLALEAEVLLGEGGDLFFVNGAAPDFAGQAPGHFAGAVGQGLRCAVEVGVEVGQAGRRRWAVCLCQCTPVAVAACGGLAARGGSMIRCGRGCSEWSSRPSRRYGLVPRAIG